MTGTQSQEQGTRPLDREILRLAVPAFLALVAEPLFLLADAAIVGHLGTPSSPGSASPGRCCRPRRAVRVPRLRHHRVGGAAARRRRPARRAGAGRGRGLAGGADRRRSPRSLGIALTGPLVALFGAGAERRPATPTTYLRLALLGVVPLLVMLAATGVLRGLQDTRTPLVVAVAGNLANIGLNLAPGLRRRPRPRPARRSARVLAQLGSALALLAVVVRAARRQGVALRPDLAGVASRGARGRARSWCGR